MADTVIVSPAVSTFEQDATTLPEAVAGIGAAVLGRFVKGPAFQPTQVVGWTDFENTFGSTDLTMYAPYAAKEYLKNQNVLNVVRVLGIHSEDYGAGNTAYDALGHYVTEPAGFTASNGIAVCYSGSAYGWYVGTIVHSNVSLTATGTLQSVVFDFASGYNDGSPFTGSYIRSDRNYVEKVLCTDPTKYVTSSVGHYIWANYEYASASLGSATRISGSMLAGIGTSTVPALSFSQEYSTAATTWVYSQNYGSGSMAIPANVRRYRLFRVVAKDDGEYPNDNIKVSVSGIRKSLNSNVSEFGYFNVIVRKFDDTDKKMTIVEQFTDCTLDPDDVVGYVARKIGDKRSTWDSVDRKFIEYGEFDSKSKYIRVEMDDQVAQKVTPESILPWGFYGYPKYTSASFPVSGAFYAIVPPLPYVDNMKWKGDFDKRIYWGVAFNDVSGSLNYGIADRMKVLPSGVTVEYDNVFSLDYISSSLGALTSSTDLNTDSAMGKLAYSHENGNVSLDALAGTDAAKFTMPLYGGFDGFDIHRMDPLANSLFGSGDGNTTGQAWNTTAYPWSYEVASMRRALDVIADPEVIDFNLLCIPGIYHPSVVNYAIQKVEDRGDAFYIADVSGSSVTNVKEWMDTAEYDTNYGATYYPMVKYYDENASKDIWLPASISAFGAYAYNDRIAHQWFAPAGFTRASINAKAVKDRLRYGDRNDLYAKNVNPIAQFPSEGIVIWGQRTLQAKQSALSSVNVRRMMLYIRKTIASSVRWLVFEPNNVNTWERFVKLVRPILEDVFTKYGIEKYKVICDSTTTTPTDVDQLRINGRVLVIPTRAAEIISIGFTLLPTGAQFSE